MGGTVNKAAALQQWNTLKTEIEKEGVQVSYIISLLNIMVFNKMMFRF